VIGSFKNYLVEEEREVFFTFGRMNPPTIDHGKIFEKLANVAGKMPYIVYLSESQDPENNPLDYRTKVKTVRKMFPRHARSVVMERSCTSAMECATKLYNQGYKNVTMVVAENRVSEFEVLLNKYNGQKTRHGFYNFSKINVVSSGIMDPDLKEAKGMSAAKMRTAVTENNFMAFSQGLPKSFSNTESKKLFNDVRKGMGLNEVKDFTKHIQLEPVSEIRESYIRARIFEEGETVVLPKKGSIVGKIKHLGANYLIVESKGEVHRCWLDDVNKLDPTNYVPHWDQAPFPDYPKPELGLRESTDRWYKHQPEWGTPESTELAKKITPGELPEKSEVPQDKDIDDREGSQPAKYHSGLKKSTKKSRDAHFKKMAKSKDYDDPSLYKDAPGDKDAREKGVKPSKYTMRFKQMYDQKMSPTDVVKQRIDREKKSDALRHDRMMDRARTRATNMKNRETKPNGKV
jgi:hypothetical protein